jgi:hypothetical protein
VSGQRAVSIRLLVLLALAVNAVAAAVSISRGLPADFGGFLNGDPQDVLGDFLAWRGTAIAPPLAMLVVLAGAGAYGSRTGVGLLGVAGTIGYLGEPQTWSFDPAATPLAVGGILVYAAMARVGFTALRERRTAVAAA